MDKKNMLSWHNLETTVQYLETTELPYNERGTANAIVSEKGGYEPYIHFNIVFIFVINSFLPFVKITFLSYFYQ